MTETTKTTLRLVQCVGLYPFTLLVACYHHLGYTFPILYDERFLAQVDQDDTDESPVVRIDGAGTVEYRDAVLQGQSAAGPYLGFHAGRQCDAQPGGDERTLHRYEGDGFIEVGPQIYTC